MAMVSDYLVVIGLGSNLSGPQGAPRDQLEVARAALSNLSDFEFIKQSPFYTSPAWPVETPPKPDYVNAAVLCRTQQSLENAMTLLLELELDFGRVRDGLWSSRSLDLDILAAEQTCYPLLEEWQIARRQWEDTGQREAVGSLYVPHLRLADRAFALKPLVDLAGNWVHPVLKRPYKDLIGDLPHADIADLKVLA